MASFTNTEGLLRTCTIIEQNANTIQGVYYDTAVYGTSGSGALTLRLNRDVLDGGMYVSAGTQTSSTFQVVLDLVNAHHGASMTIKRTNASPSTSSYTILSGSAAGAAVGAITTSVNGSVTVVYDGVNQVWR